MINTYKISKANENSNLHSNLEWSARVLADFLSLLRRIVTDANPESNRSHLCPRYLNERLCQQDVAADVKTDSNLKGRLIILVFISHLLFATLVSACPGLELVVRSQWNAQAPSQRWYFVSTPVEHVIIGHTVTAPCLSQESCAAQMRNIQNYHMELGWGDIGYNFVIGGDGRVYEGVGWSRQGVHTLGWNTKSYGIAFIGDYSQMRPSAKQLKAARYLMICGTQMVC
ncbi:peptidoglycan-recognition protein 1 [Trichonephila inaurata madagascariensis]|uniref:Peptidoglycan-recognition protein 1 n=1 Tax=Trichonephila inaurata madagascariensis TaxID=2747483 RepID=A0A8X7BZN4_9ARAC|nr:peptidoglycan-recognition protein 1 [Trichonephila inaurata madagascariensis]